MASFPPFATIRIRHVLPAAPSNATSELRAGGRGHHNAAIRGAWRDKVFVERFWRTIKYEEADPRAYDGVEEARQSIGRYIAFYNARRPHAVLDGRTADQAYSHPLRRRTAA